MTNVIVVDDVDFTNSWFGRAPALLRPRHRAEAARHLKELVVNSKEQGLVRLAQLAADKNVISEFLGAVFDLSPFLRETAFHKPEFLDVLFDKSAIVRIDQLIDIIPALGIRYDLEQEPQFMATLRNFKIEAHFLIALSDLAGVLDCQSMTQKVSALAIACTQSAVRYILRSAARAGKLMLHDLEFPERDSGWIILAMGKLGADELNYSSDIDLIVLFDPRANTLPERFEGVETFSRMTRQFVRIMQDRTADGYVFRVDLRLRPDPGSNPLAIPVEAALNYYEGRGQNWERAALIKARPIAGDIAAGERFLTEILPFIWRKYLDYAAIADIHSIKRQIHSHKGHDEIKVLGHNVKLGRGGIREIEFFVQTQQLIAGGREPKLRARKTVEALASLAREGWITQETHQSLVQEYWFLRTIEHRIQMVADQQIHTLPNENSELLRITYMSDFENVKLFSKRLRASFTVVEKHYAALFESGAELSGRLGNLVFTGDNDDPNTIETMTNLGFIRPSDMCRIIRSWHFGRYKATQSAEARERLTELTPALLKAFGTSSFPDDTLVQFDALLRGLPSGIQLFALLNTNVALLGLLITIMGAAPRLSQIITTKPHVFDGLLDPAIYREIPTMEYLAARLSALLTDKLGYEETLNRLRIFNSEQKFLIGIRMLTGALDPTDAGDAFSSLADLVLAHTFECVFSAYVEKHGVIRAAQVGLLGLGKLGSREMTAGSDIDLVLLYEHPDDVSTSDGALPLQPAQYFARLTQRLIAALSAPTGEGVLYELDLRLRPSGNKGPIATRLCAYKKYQTEVAWTWEHMALTRGRVIHERGNFRKQIDDVIFNILSRKRDNIKIYADVFEMRAMIENEKPATSIWDVKLLPGGMIDIEFIAQASILSGHCSLNVGTSTKAIISNLSFPNLSLDDRATLELALHFYTSLTQILRVCLTGDEKQLSTNKILLELLCKTSELPDVQSTKAHIAETAEKVRAIFNALFGKIAEISIGTKDH